MAARKKPSTIAEAKKAKSKTFYGKGNKKLAAVTKEELEKSGLSLRDYLNKQQGKTRRTDVKVAPRPTPKPAPKASAPASKGDLSPSSQARRAKPKTILDSGAGSKASTPKRKTPTGADLNAPEIPKSKSKTPQDILGTREKSRARRRARQETKTKEDTSMTPEQKLKGQIGISAAAAALIGPAALPILMRVATKHGPAFARSLGNKIKNLTSRQQKNVAQAANKAPTKTAAQKRTSEILKSGGRTQSARRALKRDTISKEAQAAKNTRLTPRPKGEARANATTAAAKRALGRQEDTTLIGYNKGGKIVKRKEGGNLKNVNVQKNPGLSKLPINVRNRMGYAKSGGKVVKRKEGGQVMSGNDLVSSLYN